MNIEIESRHVQSSYRLKYSHFPLNLRCFRVPLTKGFNSKLFALIQETKSGEKNSVNKSKVQLNLSSLPFFQPVHCNMLLEDTVTFALFRSFTFQWKSI